MRLITGTFRISLFIFSSLFFTSVVFSQQTEIEGKVIDQGSSEGIDIAVVYVQELNIYSFTNEDGYFNLKIADSISNASVTVIVQRLGYKRKTVVINLNSTNGILIELDPDVRSLPDVTVDGSKRTKKIKAEDLVELAIKNIPNNYASSTFLTQGYLIKKSIFRNIRRRTDYLINVREGHLYSLNNGVSYPSESQKLHLAHVRATQDYRTLLKPFSGVDSLTGFIPTAEYDQLRSIEMKFSRVEDFMRMNPVESKREENDRNKSNMAILHDDYGMLDQGFVYSHKFKLDEIIYNQYGQDSLYVVKVLPSGKSKKMLPKGSFKIPLGRLYIHCDNYAVVRYEYGIYDDPRKDFYNDRAVDFNYRVEANFTEIEGKYYLSYLKREGLDIANLIASSGPSGARNGAQRIGALVGNTVGSFDLLVSQEFYSTSIEVKPEKAKDIYYALGFSKDFYTSFEEMSDDSVFWSTYQYPPESDYDRKLRLNLKERIESRSYEKH
uniref:carboxypeptidase-like regulatory domain-containing protein n=1 Tax=Roseivirga sp. TaxID=1964215 RepID=UPI0040478169